MGHYQLAPLKLFSYSLQTTARTACINYSVAHRGLTPASKELLVPTVVLSGKKRDPLDLSFTAL